MPTIILICFALAAFWMVRRDIACREGISGALWIPTLWVAIVASRPVSMWLGGSEMGGNSLAGSTTDAMFYFALILLSFIVCIRRGVNWPELVSNNKALFLFYGYFLVSVLWSEHGFSAFKRLFKDFGNVIVLLVILTEKNPREAIKSLFIRLGYVFIPLSYLFVRYFPEIGRRYNIHSGVMEAVGVATQKNSLGAMIMICGLVLIFDLVDRPGEPEVKLGRLDLALRWGVLLLGFYLLQLCDSKTSMVCLVLGGVVLFCSKVPLVERNLSLIARCLIGSVLAFIALDYLFGIKETVLHALGRNATLTGRTEVWQYLLNLHTDPMIGMGYCTIWDSHFRANFPIWMADSAHNGYLEIYLDGGWIGVGFLLLLLAVVYVQASRRLADGDRYSVLRFVIIFLTILYNISESVFARLSPVWFFFLLAGVNPPQMHGEAVAEANAATNDEAGPVASDLGASAWVSAKSRSA